MFFITGTPRSRTAWLANFLDVPGRVTCFHDGIRGCRTWSEYVKKIEGANGPIVGDCDSGLIFFWREARAQWPDAKWILLLRLENLVFESLLQMNAYSDAKKLSASDALDSLRQISKALDQMDWGYTNGEIEGETFFDDDLDHQGFVEDLCNLIGVPFDYDRWNRLRNVKVEIMPEKMTSGRDKMMDFIRDVESRR
jgi:hypothetical protein